MATEPNSIILGTDNSSVKEIQFVQIKSLVIFQKYIYKGKYIENIWNPLQDHLDNFN